MNTSSTGQSLLLSEKMLVLIISLLLSTTTYADFDQDIENALKMGNDDAKYGQINFDSRLRYENADTRHSLRQTAEAFTLRVRLGYLTPKLGNLQAYAELEANQDVGVNNYNSGRNSKREFELIADPQNQELNRFWLSYQGIADTLIKVGRQRIKLDNERFIGSINFRQFEQTFDAAVITNKALSNTTISGGYIINSHDIFSKENDMDSGFVNINHDLAEIGSLSAYAYLLDFNESVAQNRSSNQTYGARFNGGFDLFDPVKILYTAEYAWQQNFGANPITYDASYIHFMGGASAFGVTVKVGVEQLEGQHSKGFDTPLATKHAFQGWADQFLTTPAVGLRDVYSLVSAQVMGVKVMAVYHDFDDDTGNINFGSEWNFLVSKKIGKHYSVLAKYAYYNADSFKTDTQKFWLQAGVSF